MKNPYYNDQKQIAEEFEFIEEFINHTSRLSFFRINSYKLSLLKDYFKASTEEIGHNIKTTLFNYTDPIIILSDFGFFQTETEN